MMNRFSPLGGLFRLEHFEGELRKTNDPTYVVLGFRVKQNKTNLSQYSAFPVKCVQNFETDAPNFTVLCI